MLATLWLGLLEAEEGDVHARDSLARALALAREIGFYRAEALALALSARLSHARGERTAAERESAEALRLLERHGAELTDRIVIAGTRALLLAAHGEIAAAGRVRRQLERRVRAGHGRLRTAELRAAQELYTGRLLRTVLDVDGPVFPRRASM